MKRVSPPLLDKASVTQKGAVLLGKHLTCDAHDETRPLRIVSHAHADHLVGLDQSLRKCKKTLMTPATKDLIDVLRGPLLLMSGYVETLDYEKPFQYEDEKVTFFKADHILGAAQTLVEDAEGTRIVYTGDFRIDETPILEADVLVIEATYGDPSCKRLFTADVRSQLVSLVEKGLKQGPVYVFGYHGKLQEIMQILHEAAIKAPFITSEKVFHVSKVCEKHGMNLGRLMLPSEEETWQLLREDAPCVAFCHMNTSGKIGQGSFRIIVSGWEFNTPIRQTGSNQYIVALSDHSDYDGLMEYVRQSKPKQVITDSYRVGHAEVLAKQIREQLGLSAEAQPRQQGV